jgi:hypothetical protein
MLTAMTPISRKRLRKWRRAVRRKYRYHVLIPEALWALLWRRPQLVAAGYWRLVPYPGPLNIRPRGGIRWKIH